MCYYNNKINLVANHFHIKNSINRLNKFKDEEYIKNEDRIVKEIKTLMKLIGEDIFDLYEKYGYFSEIKNVKRGKDTVSFSLSIINEDYMYNDFFISFLMYMSFHEILKHKEYYGMDLIDMDNKYNALFDNFDLISCEGEFRFKYKKGNG